MSTSESTTKARYVYQQMARNLARDVLHAPFFMPRGDADIPQAIAGRIDYLHQMLGL